MRRNKFSLSNYKLLSFNMGDLVPVGLVEVLPGDTFQHSTSAFIRLSPLVTPVMHPVHVKIHHFFVPARLLWTKSMDGEANGWESFITGGKDGYDESIYPTITPPDGGWPVGSLADYLGIVPQVDGVPVSALPFRAYNMIVNEYYRDQDLIDELDIMFDEGDDTETSTDLFVAAWEKDYFTSSRPWEQKGPSITIPLSGSAPLTGTPPVKGIGLAGQTYTAGSQAYETGASSQTTFATGRTSGQTNFVLQQDPSNPGFPNIRAHLAEGGSVDMSGVTAVDMNDLRAAMALQRWEEARARWGSRYTEYLR